MSSHKLFIANRGEIALRIIRTAHRLGIPTIAVYTPSDALSPHVSLATEAFEIISLPGESEALAYFNITSLVSTAKAAGATLLHPGYGFLSENAEFARAVRDAGITFLGPSTEIIESMGLKHKARVIAQEVGINVVPGSDASGDGLVQTAELAVSAAAKVGYPVLLKATAGGGGMGMVICNDEDELRARFSSARERANLLFHNEQIVLERYYHNARHIEVQVFGDGHGTIIHLGERECSLQRRHQKVVEESPSPFLADRHTLRDDICKAAVALSSHIRYSSAGTVEFLVDDPSGAFFFLEMNTRIQVEHPVTETSHGNVDIVEMMIMRGIAERDGLPGFSEAADLAQYATTPSVHSIEARIYAENPAEDFRPSPGILQQVKFCDEPQPEWLRIDTWVSTGTTITPFFDPLIAKVIVTAPTRKTALERLRVCLGAMKVLGPPTNIDYLLALFAVPAIVEGRTTTRFLSSFAYTPSAITIISPGISSTVQDLPGRHTLLHGIPPSGAMDSRAHKAANVLAGNSPNTEALEIISVQGAQTIIKFWIQAITGIAGGHAGIRINVNGEEIGSSWMRATIPAGGILEVSETHRGSGGGLRIYIAIRGGFPDIPTYLGSKSTSLGFGGYQGRALTAGDQIGIVDGTLAPTLPLLRLPNSLIPPYPRDWFLRVLSGPHDDTEFLTPEGIEKFYSISWVVSSNSNRMGIRLTPASGRSNDGRPILWSRKNGGEGGSHPSNILDNSYARGTLNINGDTPVILGCEGPDMGGYVCLCSVSQADMWILGQLHPGCTVRFERVSWNKAIELLSDGNRWLNAVRSYVQMRIEPTTKAPSLIGHKSLETGAELHSTLHVIKSEGNLPVVFRQAGDSAILIEYGPMTLDFSVRARIHAFETVVRNQSIQGIIELAPCVRSTMCYYDPTIISQRDLMGFLIDAQLRVNTISAANMSFPGRRITLPIVLDDRWNQEALKRYMRTTRDQAVYLPSNVEYLGKNNGLANKEEALAKLIGSDWLVIGVGFYLGCPFLVPFDPRCRLVGQKMNPSRTFTPRGAVGIAGVVAAIYPIESPGGYQLYGRTIPGWHPWSRGQVFTPEKPWLLSPFDQIRYEPISEDQYESLLKDFDAGRYEFKIESCTFSLAEHVAFVTEVADEIKQYRDRQAIGIAREEEREIELLKRWEEQQHMKLNEEEISVEEAAGISITSPISASVWKIKCKPGDEVETADGVLVILEAMKTEINITAGSHNVGRKVRGFGRGVNEGSPVNAGDTVVVLE